jgi:hypothetical protein
MTIILGAIVKILNAMVNWRPEFVQDCHTCAEERGKDMSTIIID